MATKMTKEEAIKILMGYSHTPQERAALEVLIPELAESEDERIRKELVEAFEALDIDSSWNGIPVKSILAWLKEQKPADYEAMADLERTYFCNPDKLPKWLKDDIARKELNAHTKGYNNGYKDAEKQYNESVAYHFPPAIERPLCWEPGGICTNPHMDCINCPRKTTGGGFNTTSGTSTLKAEG